MKEFNMNESWCDIVFGFDKSSSELRNDVIECSLIIDLYHIIAL